MSVFFITFVCVRDLDCEYTKFNCLIWRKQVAEQEA